MALDSVLGFGVGRVSVIGLRYCTTSRAACSIGADCNTSHSNARCNALVASNADPDNRCCCIEGETSGFRNRLMVQKIARIVC